MVRLTGTFSRIGVCKVLVAGDIFLDTYTIGKAKRISPEAPVAVIQVHHEEHRPGGAGNVILNLVSLGAEVVALGRIGDDSAGKKLTHSFIEESVSVEGIFTQKEYSTPVKNRIIAENQQIVRVDHEELKNISPELEQGIIDQLPELFQGVQVVAISDYGKGFLSKTLLKHIIQYAKERNLPVVTDPKGIEFDKYTGTTLIKPNLGEAYAAANLPLDAPIAHVAERILSLSKADMVMITRSEAGISLFHRDGTRQDYPVRIREIKDVTGAGDTVLAMLTCAMANGLAMDETVQLCNVAAGIAIERFGCARVSLSDLAKRLLEFDVVNKVFDEEHLFALQEALRGKNVSLLGISGEAGLTTAIFGTVRKLAHREGWDLLIYIRDPNPDEEFVNMLASLHDVDFIILNTDSLRNLCNLIEPDEVYNLQEGVLNKLEHVEHFLSEI